MIELIKSIIEFLSELLGLTLVILLIYLFFNSNIEINLDLDIHPTKEVTKEELMP